MFHGPRLSRPSGRARSPSGPQGGASRKAVGARIPRDRYCTSTTTLKNRIAAFSAAVAPSTDFHSPSNVATPFTSEHVT